MRFPARAIPTSGSRDRRRRERAACLPGGLPPCRAIHHAIWPRWWVVTGGRERWIARPLHRPVFYLGLTSYLKPSSRLNRQAPQSQTVDLHCNPYSLQSPPSASYMVGSVYGSRPSYLQTPYYYQMNMSSRLQVNCVNYLYFLRLWERHTV